MLTGLKDTYFKYRYRLLIAGAGLMVGVVAILLTSYARETTEHLAHQMIRFHVVANSDLVEDQLLKTKVRDEIIEFMAPLTEDCENLEETRDLIEDNLPIMKEIAEEVIKESGKDYPVYAALDYANFPTKAYGDILLPAGKYEACRIVIGEGKGENWWCVLYPPLCYLDVASGVVPLEGKQELKENLNEAQYSLIKDHKTVQYQIRFKIVDQINAWLNPENYKRKC